MSEIQGDITFLNLGGGIGKFILTQRIYDLVITYLASPQTYAQEMNRGGNGGQYMNLSKQYVDAVLAADPDFWNNCGFTLDRNEDIKRLGDYLYKNRDFLNKVMDNMVGK